MLVRIAGLCGYPVDRSSAIGLVAIMLFFAIFVLIRVTVLVLAAFIITITITILPPLVILNDALVTVSLPPTI